MNSVELFNFVLPPNAWSKKPYASTFKMTIEEAAIRHPGAVPIASTREVRMGSAIFGASVETNSHLSIDRLKPKG